MSTATRFIAEKIDKSQIKISYRGQSVSGGDFLSSVGSVAAYLNCIGVKRGDLVTIALPNIPQAIIALYAAESIGAVVNLVSPKLGREAFKIAVGEPKVLFLLPTLRKKAQEISVPKIFCGLTEYGKIQYFRLLSPFLSSTFSHAIYAGRHLPEPETFCIGSGDEPAFLLHSAGTTGEPKTVALSANALNRLVDNVMAAATKGIEVKPDLGVLSALPLFHGFGLGIGVHLAMSHVCCLPMPRFSAKKAVSIMKSQKVSVLVGVPSMFRKLAGRKDFGGEHLKNIVLMFCGGDRLDPAIKEKFEGILRRYGNETPVMEGYGMSETASVVTINVARPGNGSVGQPIPGVEIAIDGGEILLRSESMMLGYYEKGKIEPSFREYNGKEYFPTGDLGVVRGGDLYLFDRKKRTIKIGGNNVFPKQIEEIASTHPDVEDAVAVRIQYGGKPAVKLLVASGRKMDASFEKELKDLIELSSSRYSTPRVIDRVKNIKKTPLGKSDYRYYEQKEKK